MSLFWEDIANINRAYCAAHNLPQPDYGSTTMYGFDEDREYGRMLEANHDDLMDQLGYAELAKVIIHDHDLCDTDLLQQLMTATALWDKKPETALERMKSIDHLVWVAVDNIAKKMSEKEFDDMCEKL